MLPSYVIKQMQIKTTTRYQYRPVRMAKIWNPDTTKCWQDCGATETLTHCWWKCKMVQSLWKTFWWFLTNLIIFSPYDLAIRLLGIYLKNLKTYVHTRTCTGIFIAALLITAKTWKQPKWPSVRE